MGWTYQWAVRLIWEVTKSPELSMCTCLVHADLCLGCTPLLLALLWSSAGLTHKSLAASSATPQASKL